MSKSKSKIEDSTQSYRTANKSHSSIGSVRTDKGPLERRRKLYADKEAAKLRAQANKPSCGVELSKYIKHLQANVAQRSNFDNFDNELLQHHRLAKADNTKQRKPTYESEKILY